MLLHRGSTTNRPDRGVKVAGTFGGGELCGFGPQFPAPIRTRDREMGICNSPGEELALESFARPARYSRLDC